LEREKFVLDLVNGKDSATRREIEVQNWFFFV
jgi:hypothetical protein